MLIRLLVFVFLCIFNADLNAANPVGGSEPNGCGSGWNAPFVPDKIIALCDFSQACNEHDACYGKCEKKLDGVCEYRRCREGGDLYGKADCENVKFSKLIKAAIIRREQCDINLQNKIISTNDQKVCSVVAIVYRKAVRFAGDKAFVGMVPVSVSIEHEEYNEAIKAFLSSGTEKQFSLFIKEEQEGNLDVDFQDRLIFTPENGLKNR
ncbi:Uncharacterised protein [Serratia quinivorans]|uniref:hypothetical protein n=1 Tax=Serratia quinivorans TaxID=137545 RepID=UPI0021776486|nr:hypothetical protein [Serratia quinivorans]CAI1933227.1 Uncharacterised protein [Serratia quinivorans]